MKKIYTLIASLLLVFNWLQAQPDDTHFYLGGNLFAGVTTLLNQNNYGLPEPNYGPSFALHGGAVLGLAFTTQHQLVMELNYATLNQKYADDFSPGATRFHLEKNVLLQFLQIPIFYRYVFTPKGDVGYFNDHPTWYMTAGLQASVLLDADVKYKIDGTPVSWDQVKQAFNVQTPSTYPAQQWDSARRLFEPVTVDIVGGFGWEKFLNPNLRLGIEFRGYVGLMDINSGESNSAGTSLWRIPKPGHDYNGSHNFAAGLRVNLCHFFERQ
jgi:hypothetical protein